MRRRILTAREQHEMLSPWHQASAEQDAAEAAGTRLPPTPVRRQQLQDTYWMKKPWAEGETLLRPHGKNVTLYHRTTSEEADRLVEKGFKRKKNPDTKDVYFSDVLDDAQATTFGDAIVKVVLPHHAIGPRDTAPQTIRHRRLDDPEDTEWHQDGPAENWYQIDSKHLKGVPVERIAMPAVDAYDQYVAPRHRRDTQDVHPGPWYHGSDHEFQPGDMVSPHGGPSQWGPEGENYYINGRENRPDWVWMTNDPGRAGNWGGRVYEVQPEVEGPWEWNLPKDKKPDDPWNEGYVAPRARVVREFGPEDWAERHRKMEEEMFGSMRTRQTTAAVTQDLVDQLHNEFHDWWHTTGKAIPAQDGWGQPSYEAHRGPVGWWPNVENFLADRYPAAHRGFSKGWEGAQQMLDSKKDKNVYGETPEEDRVISPYETGPDAEATHGYDPAEIAAGMVLLHNQSHPLRGGLAQADQDRLNDIAQKRFQMQRAYEQRQTIAGHWMP